MKQRMADSPQHVAIIMDGNGRWARSRGMPRPAGHRASIKVVRRVVQDCVKRRVRYLTLFAFSSENWRRPPDEVGMLMKLFLDCAGARSGGPASQSGEICDSSATGTCWAPNSRKRMQRCGNAHRGQSGLGADRRHGLRWTLGHRPGLPLARRGRGGRHAVARRSIDEHLRSRAGSRSREFPIPIC